MISEAQKRASAKYVKENVRKFELRFYPKEADILAHFEKQENKSGYLKRLIREDMQQSD